MSEDFVAGALLGAVIGVALVIVFIVIALRNRSGAVWVSLVRCV